MVSPNVGVPFHAANLRPFGAPPSKGRREKEGRIGHQRNERQMRKAERCAAYVGKRESLTANDNDLISVSLKIVRAPSSGRGRRAKRGGVGFPECGSTVSRGQPPPLRGTSFQRKEGEREAHLCANESPRAPLRAPQSRPSKKRRIQIRRAAPPLLTSYAPARSSDGKRRAREHSREP